MPEKYEVPKYEITPGYKEEEYKPSTEYKKEEYKPKEEEYKPSTEYKKEEYKPKEEECKPSTGEEREGSLSPGENSTTSFSLPFLAVQHQRESSSLFLPQQALLQARHWQVGNYHSQGRRIQTFYRIQKRRI